ncbi:MAG: FKBP-type peptidyl-prolyl cis-trans isomerase [Nocardioides sp.]
MRASRLVAAATAAVLTVGLTACGSDDSTVSSSEMTELVNQAVAVSGEVGAKPKVTWSEQLTADATSVQTLVAGDVGEPLGDGDSFFGKIWLENGYTMKEASGWDWPTDPTLMSVSADSMGPTLVDALTGVTPGSRVMIATAPEGVFGDPAGGSSFGIGNEDTVVVIVDVLSTVPKEASGTSRKAPRWAPSVTEGDGIPTALDFKGVPEPSDGLRVGYLIKGDGDKLTAKDTQVVVNYLGQVYGKAKPFDESFTKTPFTMSMKEGVVEGWLQGLRGVPVGSRVILSIPPALGYGDKGNGDIKGTDTMFFVIDVLAKA